MSALSDEARGQRDGGEKLGRIHQMAAVLRHLSQDVVDGELARAALLLLLFLFSSRQTPPLPSAPLSAPPAVSELLSTQKRKLVKARIKWLRVRVRALLPVLTERTPPLPPSLPVMSRDELGSGPGRRLCDDA